MVSLRQQHRRRQQLRRRRRSGDHPSTSRRSSAGSSDNGGQTDTQAPVRRAAPRSAPPTAPPSPATDQRGVSRPASGCLTIGSVRGADRCPIIQSSARPKGRRSTQPPTLGATITPNGAATSYVVEYGTSTAYGQQTSPIDIGAGSTQTVSEVVGGLQPSTTYDFRIDATNANSTTFGINETFTTRDRSSRRHRRAASSRADQLRFQAAPTAVRRGQPSTGATAARRIRLTPTLRRRRSLFDQRRAPTRIGRTLRYNRHPRRSATFTRSSARAR